MKGQVNIGTALAVGVTIALASIGSFFGLNNRVAATETKQAVLETRLESMDNKLTRIIDKLDPIPLRPTSTKHY